jgi:hypothetical protein
VKPLQILEILINSNNARTTDLLKNPEEIKSDNWHMCLPPSFNSALDIQKTERQKKTIWTQGASFSFKKGDIIYDHPEAYSTYWGDALKSIKICIQVISATNASYTTDGRFSGSIEFKVFKPNKDKSQLVEISDQRVTQDEFVKLLIKGF